MSANVHIKCYNSKWELIEERHGHNTWVENGRKYLAEIMALIAIGGDIPERIDRLAHVGFGIGGNKQNRLDLTDTPPFSVDYQVGADPNGSNGHQYNHAYPIAPLISTLERPIRISGGNTPYPGASTDLWLFSGGGTPIPLMFYSVLGSTIKISLLLDATMGTFLSPGPYLDVPLSEIGLFTDAASATDDPYFHPLVAYHSFDTIVFGSVINAMIVDWVVTF